jgi:hypothetical protein
MSSYLNKLSSVLKALPLPAMALFLPYEINLVLAAILDSKASKHFFKLARAMVSTAT